MHLSREDLSVARYIHNIPILRSLQRKIRKKRADMFTRLMKPQASWKILDVGGTYPTWEQSGMELFKVTLLNLGVSILPSHLEGRVIAVAGDATSLPYENRSFDLIYSNSVIEHVGSTENQKRFAAEVLRAGQALWIQTPAQEFFFEPHYMAFLFIGSRVHGRRECSDGVLCGGY
jgi:hypothetical protein